MTDKGISERVRQQSVRLTFLEGNRDTDVTFEGQKFKVETFLHIMDSLIYSIQTRSKIQEEVFELFEFF
jgi:hypothetical protein